MLALAAGKHVLESGARLDTLHLPDGIHNDFLLLERGGVVDGRAIESGQHIEGFLLVIVVEKPSIPSRALARKQQQKTGRTGRWRAQINIPRRLWEHHNTGNQQDGKHNLESNREPPLRRVVDIAESEIKPIRNQSADGNHGGFDTDQQPTVMGSRCFGLPDGNRGRVCTITNALQRREKGSQ